MIISIVGDEYRGNLLTSYLQQLFSLLSKHHQNETIDWYVVR